MSKLIDAIYDCTLADPRAKRTPVPEIKQRSFRRFSRARKKRKLLCPQEASNHSATDALVRICAIIEGSQTISLVQKAKHHWRD